MSRQNRRRLERLEGLAKSTAVKRNQQNAEFLDSRREAAREHAAKLVVLFRYGEPQLDEPLDDSWSRALRRLHVTDESDWMLVPLQFYIARLPGDTEAAKLADVYSTMPNWLLAFCMAPLDAFLLGFKLRSVSDAPRPGRQGLREMASAWPDLPKGTLQAGDPIPEAGGSLDTNEIIELHELLHKDDILWNRRERRRCRELLDKMNPVDVASGQG